MSSQNNTPNIENVLNEAIKNPQRFIEQGNDLLETLNPELRGNIEKQAKNMAQGPLGNELRRKLQQQGFNRRKLKQMQRTNKLLVKGKKNEDVDRGIVITSSRKLKSFNIYRSQENVCVGNAINGVPIIIPLYQRLQATPWATKGVKMAYIPRGIKDNRRAKKFLGPKAKVRGDVAIFLESGSLTKEQLEEIEQIMVANNELVNREEETKLSQTQAKEAGMGEGLLPGEKAVFGNVEKAEKCDYGNDEDYLLDSDDEGNNDEDKEGNNDEESEESDEDNDDEIDQLLNTM